MNEENKEMALKVAKITAMAKDMGYDITSRNSVYEFIQKIVEDGRNELSDGTMKQVNFMAEAILAAGLAAQKLDVDPTDILEDDDVNEPEIYPDDMNLIIHHVWKTGGHPSNKDDIRKYVISHMGNSYKKFQDKIVNTVYQYYLDNKLTLDARLNKMSKFSRILQGLE